LLTFTFQHLDVQYFDEFFNKINDVPIVDDFKQISQTGNIEILQTETFQQNMRSCKYTKETLEKATDSDHADDFVLKISAVVNDVVVRVSNPRLSTHTHTHRHPIQALTLHLSLDSHTLHCASASFTFYIFVFSLHSD